MNGSMNHTTNSSQTNPPLVCHGLEKLAFQLSTSIEITALASVVLSSAITFVSVVGNSLVLYTIVSTKTLHTPTFYLVAYSSVVWMLNSLLTNSLLSAVRIQELQNIHNCLLKLVSSFFAFAMHGLSIFGTTAVSFDKFIAIVIPSRSKTLPKGKINLAFLGISTTTWLSGFVLVYLGIIDDQYLRQAIIGFSCTWFLLLVFVYVTMLIRLRKMRRITASVLSALEDAQRLQAEKDDKNRILTTLLLIFCYTIPLVIKGSCVAARSASNNKLSIAYHCHRWSGLLLAVNAAINPVVHILRTKAIKTEVLKKIGIFRSSTTPQNVQLPHRDRTEVKESEP